MFLHAVRHAVSPAAQQAFTAQPRPAGQALPQAPQLVGSDVVSTQTPPHRVCPAGHGAKQAPSEQTSPLVHARPHIPQCVGVVRMFVSQPLAVIKSQSPKLGLHVSIVHVESTHTPTPFAGRHGRSQRPQLAASVRRSTSHPSASRALQSANPSLHAYTHSPAAQTATAPGRGAQLVAPQGTPASGEASLVLTSALSATTSLLTSVDGASIESASSTSRTSVASADVPASVATHRPSAQTVPAPQRPPQGSVGASVGAVASIDATGASARSCAASAGGSTVADPQAATRVQNNARMTERGAMAGDRTRRASRRE